MRRVSRPRAVPTLTALCGARSALSRRVRVQTEEMGQHPERNGRLERFHRTLKEAVMNPPAQTLADQQRAFDAFRRVFNEERPHEALGQRAPTSRYAPSPRPYPDKVGSPEYPEGVEVRRVRSNGEIKWAGERVFVKRGADWRACGARSARRPAVDGPVRPFGDRAVGRLRPAYNQDSRLGLPLGRYPCIRASVTQSLRSDTKAAGERPAAPRLRTRPRPRTRRTFPLAGSSSASRRWVRRRCDAGPRQLPLAPPRRRALR